MQPAHICRLRHRSLHLLLLKGDAAAAEKPDADFVDGVASSTSQQMGLLAACAELVRFAATGKRSFPALTARLQALDSLMDLWHLLPYLQQAASQANVHPDTYICCSPACKSALCRVCLHERSSAARHDTSAPQHRKAADMSPIELTERHASNETGMQVSSTLQTRRLQDYNGDCR